MLNAVSFSIADLNVSQDIKDKLHYSKHIGGSNLYGEERQGFDKITLHHNIFDEDLISNENIVASNGEINGIFSEGPLVETHIVSGITEYHATDNGYEVQILSCSSLEENDTIDHTTNQNYVRSNVFKLKNMGDSIYSWDSDEGSFYDE